MKWWLRPLILFISMALLAIAGAANAADVSARWAMNQSGGVVADGVGSFNLRLEGPWHEVDGAVGRAIRFNYSTRTSLAKAMGSRGVNPGLREFGVAAYLKTDTVPRSGHYSPNVTQKGYYGDAGQWKMQLIGTAAGTIGECRFKGDQGSQTVKDNSATKLDDTRWHSVVCWRTDDGYGITVDGVRSAVTGSVGKIANGRRILVGAKGSTADVTDQFQGTLDCVVYVVGTLPSATARHQVPC